MSHIQITRWAHCQRQVAFLEDRLKFEQTGPIDPRVLWQLEKACTQKISGTKMAPLGHRLAVRKTGPY